MPDSLTRAAHAFLDHHHIRDQLLVVGVSGGADSLALLHSLMALRGVFALRLHVAHLNHQLRGDESEADALFVEQTAREWGLPATVESHDVEAFARARRFSLEEAARMVRYGFLEQVAEREGAHAVAVAHHADDQVETIVMHFLRGAGLAGLRGMQPVSTHPFHPPLKLLRPLLDVTRAEIEAYCATHQLAPRVDATNADTQFTRNRIRHEILPLLEQVNPNLREVLRRNAQVMADNYDYVAQRAQGAYARTLIGASDERVSFSLSGWQILQPSLKRGLIRLAVIKLRPHLRHLEAQHTEDALRVANGAQCGARATLPAGLWLFRDFDAIVIGETLPEPDLPPAPARSAPIQQDGETKLTHGWRIEAHTLSRERLPADALQGIDPYEAFLDADSAGDELMARARKPDDTFKPLGLDGHGKLLRRWMIDAKVPATWRARTPLVVAGDEVLWVVGWRIADTAKVTADTRRVLHVRFVKDAEEF